MSSAEAINIPAEILLAYVWYWVSKTKTKDTLGTWLHGCFLHHPRSTATNFMTDNLRPIYLWPYLKQIRGIFDCGCFCCRDIVLARSRAFCPYPMSIGSVVGSHRDNNFVVGLIEKKWYQYERSVYWRTDSFHYCCGLAVMRTVYIRYGASFKPRGFRKFRAKAARRKNKKRIMHAFCGSFSLQIMV